MREVALVRSAGSTARDFAMLTKPRLSTLVLITAGGGMWLAGAFGLRGWLTLLAIHGVVASANAFNCVLERDSDRYMARTLSRPLPAGRMDPWVAVVFAAGLALVSLPALMMLANPLTAALGLLALVLYVGVYTPLKPRTHWAMVVGAVPGAIPPLMGWTAMTDEISRPGVALFLILFFWQLPHFIAIALFRMPEYRKARLESVPLALGEDSARAFVVAYTLALAVVSELPYRFAVVSAGYLGVAAALNAAFLAYAMYGWVTRAGPGWARRAFFATLAQLTGLFAALALFRA